MKIGILGTGTVGRTLGVKLAQLRHDVILGTRDTASLLARATPDAWGNPPFAVWQKTNPAVRLGTFAETAAHGEIVVNATAGTGSLEALRLAGAGNLAGKILIDVANPLDFSNGMPPSLFVSNTDSLGERIQREFPEAKVVKTLNTMNAGVMVSPESVGGGDHTVFVCGNDAGAKARVTEILRDWLGWEDVVDLGDITGARGTESILPIWVRLFGVLQTPKIAFKVVR